MDDFIHLDLHHFDQSHDLALGHDTNHNHEFGHDRDVSAPHDAEHAAEFAAHESAFDDFDVFGESGEPIADAAHAEIASADRHDESALDGGLGATFVSSGDIIHAGSEIANVFHGATSAIPADEIIKALSNGKWI